MSNTVLLKNLDKRLITLTTPAVPVKKKDADGKEFIEKVLPGKKFPLMPAGEAVEVPAEVAARSFVKQLINKGKVVRVEQTAPVEAETESDADDGETKADLIAQAELLGVEVSARWSKDKIRAAIAEAEVSE